MTDQDHNNFKALSTEKQAKRLQALAAEALERYGISKEAEINLIAHRENTVFKVEDPETGKRYVIRVHRPGYQTEQTIRSEMQWMDALRETGIYTPTPLKAVDGTRVQTVSIEGVPDARHCSMLDWVDGRHLSAAGSSNAEDYRLVGQVNARFHRHSKTWKLPGGFYRQRWDEEGMVGENPLWGRFWELTALSKDQLDLIYRARAAVRKRLERFGKGPDRFGLIHADLMPDNILMHQGNPYVIDFDDSGFGWYMYDLATLLTTNIPDEQRVQTARDAWVDGYRSVESLADEDLAELPVFMMCRFLVVLGWVQTRRETAIARNGTGTIVEMACAYAEAFISAQ